MKILVDTSVWLDLAKDYRQQPTIRALEELVGRGVVELVLPRQVLEEFQRNKARVIAESSKSLSSVFKRVKEVVGQFGKEDQRAAALAQLGDVDHRLATLGEAVNEAIGRLEALFRATAVTETTDDVILRAGTRALHRRAPFHKSKNSIADAVLIELYADIVSQGSEARPVAFVTHNKHDFSNMGVDERQPHPDVADLFAAPHSTYSLALGELLTAIAPEWMEDIKWEFEYQDEYRRLGEIVEAENLLFRQVWYNRHWNQRIEIESGRVRLVTKEQLSTTPYREDECLDTVWEAALAAAKRTEDEVGLDNLGPWDDFEWGMLNGKLSALRWVLGSEWDFLDT